MPHRDEAAAGVSTFYRLDRTDRVVEVGGDWDAFALANGGELAVKDWVLGTHFYAHVQGESTQMLIRTLLDGARHLQRPSQRPYRCDSPGVRRDMAMEIRPETDGVLMVSHRVLLERPLPAPLHFRVDDGVAERVMRCSMCNRLKVQGTWMEPEAAWRQGGLSSPDPNVIGYGVCPACIGALGSRRPVHLSGGPAPGAANRDR